MNWHMIFCGERTVACPRRGKIGIFNRSYYEEVLVVRVHPEFLDRQRLPDALRGKQFWKNRYEDINAFERYLTRNGIAIRKFFLHLSKKEQKKRFLSRLDDRDKNWKFWPRTFGNGSTGTNTRKRTTK